MHQRREGLTYKYSGTPSSSICTENIPKGQGKVSSTFTNRQEDSTCLSLENGRNQGREACKDNQGNLEIESIPISRDLPKDRVSNNRPVCIQTFQSDKKVYFLEAGSEQCSNRCLSTKLERGSDVCVPSILPDKQGSSKNKTGQITKF